VAGVEWAGGIRHCANSTSTFAPGTGRGPCVGRHTCVENLTRRVGAARSPRGGSPHETGRAASTESTSAWKIRGRGIRPRDRPDSPRVPTGPLGGGQSHIGRPVAMLATSRVARG